MPTTFLLTGVTGGLGAKILADMLKKHHVPARDIIATSRAEDNRERFEAQGLHFRVADYNRPDTLVAAFDNVENLLFISSSQIDTAKRIVEHTNVIEAVKAAGVKKVWYVSLAFGGFGDSSKVSFEQPHYETENLLRDSGLDCTSLRAGVYADAFPLFLNQYPTSESILLPNLTPPVAEGKIAFASRDELGEGIANLLSQGLGAFPSIKPQTAKNILLLTGPQSESLVDLVPAINRGRGVDVPVRYLDPEEWIDTCASDDVGGKPRLWFEASLSLLRGFIDGDAKLTDPALETLLGRRPETGTETVERLTRAESGYTWHQNDWRQHHTS